jgi:hypothetical protein
VGAIMTFVEGRRGVRAVARDVQSSTIGGPVRRTLEPLPFGKDPAVNRFSMRRRLLPVALAAVLAVPVVALSAGSAEAQVRVRAQGNVRVNAGATVRVRTTPPRRHYRPHVRTRVNHHRLRIRGSIVIGGGLYYGRVFAPPPPPPPPPVYCDCDDQHAVPAYYAPAPPPPPASVTVAATPHAPLPRLALGVFAGGVKVDKGAEGDDVGVLGRVRLTRGLALEAELSKTEIEDGARVDRRLGGALLWDLAPRARLSPHLLAGMGMTQVDMDGGRFSTEQNYGEIGAGLTYRATSRLHFFGDLRAGARSGANDAPSGAVLRSIAPPEDEHEGYTRGRLGAILWF